MCWRGMIVFFVFAFGVFVFAVFAFAAVRFVFLCLCLFSKRLGVRCDRFDARQQTAVAHCRIRRLALDVVCDQTKKKNRDEKINTAAHV